jgi:PIN like domain
VDSDFTHILDFQKQGVLDEEWIPRIAKEGGWIVVTSDRGRRGPKKGAKLPIVCKRHGVTHIALSATVVKKSSFEKLGIILQVWPEMKKLADAPKGSAHLLRMKGRKYLVPVIEQIDPVPPADDQ